MKVFVYFATGRVALKGLVDTLKLNFSEAEDLNIFHRARLIEKRLMLAGPWTNNRIKPG